MVKPVIVSLYSAQARCILLVAVLLAVAVTALHPSTTTATTTSRRRLHNGRCTTRLFQESDTGPGTVLRTAFRKYDKQNSKPSGRHYTTRKDAQPNGIQVTKAGISGDYNHYRTLALKSTPDRAVCLWTTDVLPLLHEEQFPVQVGDLGENISLEGVPFTFFQIGKRYQFVSDDASTVSVIVEITERTEPCANLCKLPYINEESLQPKERIQKCQDFIELLNQADGLRGWYAKVIQEGTIRPGDKVVAVEEEEEV